MVSHNNSIFDKNLKMMPDGFIIHIQSCCQLIGIMRCLGKGVSRLMHGSFLHVFLQSDSIGACFVCWSSLIFDLEILLYAVLLFYALLCPDHNSPFPQLFLLNIWELY